MTPVAPSVSVVVVTYDHARELPRTLYSLLPPFQRDLDDDELELIVVDNGSPRPAAEVIPSDLAARVSLHRLDPAPPSPARAANLGLAVASGPVVGLVIDGARMASPRLLSTALMATRLHDRPIVTAPAWQLSDPSHTDRDPASSDQEVEDRLLAGAGWESDGYNLFTIAAPAGSSGRGLLGPKGESSSLFMRADLWDELGGLDERFSLPGGGLVNHDLYRRACESPDVSLFVLLGEGTFHQSHGGAATSGRVSRQQMWAEYEALRGCEHRPPSRLPVFVGTVPPQYVPHLRWSLDRAQGSMP